MVVCVECGAKIESLYKIFDRDTIQIKKCNKCGCIADKYQKCDFMLMFISVILLKESAFRHILSNYNERYINKGVIRSKYRNYMICIVLIFFWSFLDAYKLTMVYNCTTQSTDSSISDIFLSVVYHIYSYDSNNLMDLSLNNISSTDGKVLTRDQIFGDNNHLSMSTIDRLIYVFYQISLYMTNNSRATSFDCEILTCNSLMSKLYRFLIHYNTPSSDPLELVKQAVIYNVLTVLLTAVIVTVIVKDVSKFKDIVIVFLGSMYGKAFIIPTIIWNSNIFIDMFVYIYVMYSYIITMHIYLDKPYSTCFAIAAIPQIILSISEIFIN